MRFKRNKLALAVLLSFALPVWADEITPNYYHLVFNKSKRTSTEDVTSVYFIKGYYYISKKDSEVFGIQFDDTDLYAFNGDMFVRLNNVGRIQESGSDLLIDTQSNKLEATTYNMRVQNEKSKREFTDSAYMNYSVTTDSKSKDVAVNTSIYKTFQDGVLYNLNTNVTNSSDGIQKNVAVLDAYREQYFQDKMTKLRIGTSYTSGGSLVNPASFVGIQYKKDFNIDSNYLKNPYLSASGTADSRSIAELYVNDKYLAYTPLEAGPYNFNNIATGQTSNNDVKVVVKDLNGNLVQVNNVSLVGSPYNLKQGSDNYSFEAGSFREGYYNFSSPFVSGTYAYGVNDQLTLEGHIEGSSEQKRASVNATYATKYGTVQYGVAKGSKETLQKLQYNYQNGGFYSNFYLLRSDNFHAFGNTSRLIPDQNVLTLGYRYNDWNFSFNDVKVRETNRYSFGVSKNIGAANLYVSLTRQNSETGFYVNLSMPFGDDKQWRVGQVANKSDGQTSYAVNVNKFADYNDWGLNADIVKNSDSSNSVSGTVFKNSQYGNVYVYGNNINNNNQVIVKGEGSIVFDQGVHLSKPIYEGYAVVNTGQKNIPVSLNNTEVSTSDSSGIAIVPNVSQSNDNKIAISVTNLPENLTTEDTDVIISPLNHFKADIKFNVKKDPVLLNFNTSLKGMKTVNIDGKNYLVSGNNVYFDDYIPNKEYMIELESCKAKFSIPEKTKLNQIIKVNCQ